MASTHLHIYLGGGNIPWKDLSIEGVPESERKSVLTHTKLKERIPRVLPRDILEFSIVNRQPIKEEVEEMTLPS